MCDFGVSRISNLCFKIIIVIKTRGKKRKRPDTDFNAAKALLPGCGRFLNELREKIQAENQDLPSHEVTKTPGNNWRRPQEQV